MSRMLALFSPQATVSSPVRITVTAFAEALRVLGDEHLRFGRYRQARRAYRAALQVEPKVSALHARLAKAWEDDPQGNDDFALKCWRRAVKHDALNALAWAGLGRTAERTGHRVMALKAVAKSVALDPANVDVLSLALATLRGLGKLERAWSLLCKARFLAPHCSGVKALWDRARFDFAAKSPRVARSKGRATIPFLKLVPESWRVDAAH